MSVCCEFKGEWSAVKCAAGVSFAVGADEHDVVVEGGCLGVLLWCCEVEVEEVCWVINFEVFEDWLSVVGGWVAPCDVEGTFVGVLALLSGASWFADELQACVVVFEIGLQLASEWFSEGFAVEDVVPPVGVVFER